MKKTIESTTKLRLRRAFYAAAAVAIVGGVGWAGYWLSPTNENIIPNIKPNIVFNNSCINCDDTATSDTDTDTSTDTPTDTPTDTSTRGEGEGDAGDASADTDTGTE